MITSPNPPGQIKPPPRLLYPATMQPVCVNAKISPAATIPKCLAFKCTRSTFPASRIHFLPYSIRWV